MRTQVAIFCFVLACHAVLAGDSKNASSPATATAVVDGTKGTATSGTAGGQPYMLVHKSVFAASATDHNPFWPIGWSNLESLPVDAPPPVAPHADDFVVTTIMLNEPPIAVINGKDMDEGETATLNVNGEPVMVQLMAVRDGQVTLRWQNQNIVVPLSRQDMRAAPSPSPSPGVSGSSSSGAASPGAALPGAALTGGASAGAAVNGGTLPGTATSPTALR